MVTRKRMMKIKELLKKPNIDQSKKLNSKLTLFGKLIEEIKKKEIAPTDYRLKMAKQFFCPLLIVFPAPLSNTSKQ